MQRWKILAGLLVGGVLVSAVPADEPGRNDKKLADNPKEVVAAFERLKKLAGEWQAASPKDEVAKGKVAIRYQLTAGGSAVVETIFPGEDMEMVSVYHKNGNELLMTHYCCLGNQPRMRARIGANKDELVFEFAGGGNLDPAKDMHIHDGRIRFVDADHIHSEWEMYADGKPGEKHAFDLIRKK
jgi:hypothetical protein